ncbi:PAAR domain-containing protein [Burkholderia glumae]|uniref:PAAR domain-containing protein n=1 Tax=Burkholderia glumae TaxID=337 RepID=UPI0009B7FC44|nr:PAAR domain-containing protein [Burkholderia glumae]MCM2485808.1 PAAR domain-containing protein [Burkholderia glumae]MCM2511643.1 PAAR domain-containing protein [Burkholderia glumae]MCR1770248.1 PAAR domain-containing protein [Burkholderia glumae]QHP93992.1 PAAR domain-containing protein [Burkholderia glumae]QJP70238.1 PAAR domain-containing protein [Burkholderia glumae]
MKSPIRKNDELEHGGRVTGGSSTMEFMGLPLARKGDAALCDLHGETVIDEGDESFPDQDGKPVAMHLHRCACGCRLISSLQNVHIG